MEKITFKTEKDAQEIISTMEKRGAYLIEVANHIDGNYLVFSDEPVVREKSKDEIIAQLQLENIELKNQLKQYKDTKG